MNHAETHDPARRAGSRNFPGVSASSCAHAVLALLAYFGFPAAAAAQPNTHVIRAAAYVNSEGELQSGALLVIEDPKILQVGGDAPVGAPSESYDGAVISAGLIDIDAALGAWGNLSERDRALQPEAVAKDAFDRYHAQLGVALRAGVTTFALVPKDDNLIGGRIAICQTSGPSARPVLLDDAGPLKLSLAPALFQSDREPTSRAGAIAMLRGELQRARDDASGAPSTLAQFTQGKLAGIMTTPSGADVLVALDLIKAHGLKLTLRHTHDARAVAREIAAAGISVIVDPYEFSSSPRDASAAGVFERAGVRVTIAGGLPGRAADSLRTAAAVAVRNGMSPAAARRAITSAPAAALGIADRVGSIERGRLADLVVFSGDPLDLRSRVLAVYVGGRRVFVAEPSEQRER